jgi:hypothetical protein
MPRYAGYTQGAPLPPYVARAHEYDDSWKDHALCTGHIKEGSPFRKAWITDAGTKHQLGDQTVVGSTLIEVALTFCAMCPVQWDCAVWAINVREPCGTWAMPYEDLERCKADPEGALTRIARARVTGTSVQVAMRGVRRRTRPTRVVA